MDKQKIVLIAGRVRQWMKRMARESDYDIDPTDLACGCAIASARLLNELIKNGIKGARIVAGDWHAYVMVNDHVLDVTATQFSGFKDHKVLFMPWNEFMALPHNKEWWTSGIGKPITCPKKFRKTQLSGEWPHNQIIDERHLV